MDSGKDSPNGQSFGVYTKTVVQSPVVQCILNARIRHRLCKDVIFIGQDFIQLKEIGLKGDLQHIANKTDFDAHIRNAKVLDIDDDDDSKDFLVKLERDRDPSHDSSYPPQVLVLALDSNHLTFVYYRSNEHGSCAFVQQTVPMPSFDRILFQPGEHLAVDPSSRALAVAACEREVILYAAKPKKQMQDELSICSQDWCPVSAQRPLQVDGAIHLMDFLTPSEKDHDRIVLLLVISLHQRTRAILVDWHSSQSLMHIDLHPAQPLNFFTRLPDLLIPLRDATFLLVTGSIIVRYKDIMSGHSTHYELLSPREEPCYPGTSSYPPAWASWTKPCRSRAATRGNDFVYIAREDGLVYLFQIDVRGAVQISDAGNLGCHVSTAFASLGDEGGPDLLAVAGETSSGSIISIGLWPTTKPVEQLSREDSMTFDPLHILTNWASVTDMVNCKLIQSSKNLAGNTDALIVTSGRQPFGSLAHLRNGLEARLLQTASLDLVRYTTDTWALPDPSGSILLVLSMPEGCKVLELEADLSDIVLRDASSLSALESTHRTLLMGLTIASQIVQVTSRGICTSGSLHANFEDTSKIMFKDDVSITAAALVSERSILITTEKHSDTSVIAYYTLSSSEDEPRMQQRTLSTLVSETPLAIAAEPYTDGIIALIVAEDGYVTPLAFDEDGTADIMSRTRLLILDDELCICDHVVLLHTTNATDPFPRWLAVCGSREGKLIIFEIDLAVRGKLLDIRILELGHSTVKLVQLKGDPSTAIALTDSQTYYLRWDGRSSVSLEIHNLWAVDKQRPEYSQGPVVAATQLPPAAHLSSDIAAEALVMLSGDDILIAFVDLLPTTTTRQIPISGTPNRVIHSDSLRSLICSSLCADVRLLSSKSNSTLTERRQIWPVINFIPDRGGATYSHRMQPGERVNALLEWTYRPSDDKTYSHVLVGGSYIRQSGKRRGKVSFLQPSNKSWEVVDVTERSKDYFDDDVYALALYDSVTYVACAGERVYVKRYEQKWQDLCSAFKLASPGVHITIETNHSGQRVIVISTMRDSLVTLKLAENETQEQGSSFSHALQALAMGPRADTLIHHLVLDPASEPYRNNTIDQYILTTTRYGQVLGMTTPKSPSARHTTATLVFEAQLPRSLTRLASTTPPKRKGPPPPGVLPTHITGSSTDGTLYALVLLQPPLLRRLSWLQRLIEWSPTLSPHSFSTPVYSPGPIDFPLSRHGKNRALPIGFSGSDTDLVVLHTTIDKLQDLHIDGDILGRVLQPGGKRAVTAVLQDLARDGDGGDGDEDNDGGVGAWVKSHLGQELLLLDEVVGLVAGLQAWV